MKKLVLMALLTMGIVGCKKEAAKPAVEENTPAEACINNMEDYKKLTDVGKKVEWLKTNGIKVCRPVLFRFIQEEHKLEKAEYNRLKNEYGSQSPLTMKWKEIHDAVVNRFYDKYVGFNIEGNKITGIKLVDDFNPEGGTYSVPLFLSIADTLDLKEDDMVTEFEFIQTKEKKCPVIFKVVNSENVQLNYSTKPSK